MRFSVPPLGSTTQPIEAEQMVHIETRSVEGLLIEGFDADAHGSFGQFVYNVAGAAPLVQWTAAYGNASAPPERMLGAPRWSSTSVGILFADAPKSISTKGGGGTREVLSGLGDAPPAQQLNMLADQAEGLRLATAHARWDPLGSRNVAQWLWVAKTGPGFQPLLKARLAEAPDDVLLRRMEQDSADETGRAAVCQRDQASAAAAPQNANLQYLVARCLPEGADKDRAFVDGHARFPDHGWYAYAAAYVDASHAQWPQAIASADLARRKLLSLGNELGVDIARMRRLLGQDGSAELTELGKGSDALQRLLALESGQGIDTPAYKSYAELARGRVDSAVQLAHSKPQSEARLLRLAAASDRASPVLVAQALALPIDKGLDESTVWASVGLAARAGRELSAFEPMLQRAASRQADAMLRFIDALKRGEAPEQAERWLDGLTPELRGQGYSVGTIMLGARAPRAWRDGARRLLFASERPYFG